MYGARLATYLTGMLITSRSYDYRPGGATAYLDADLRDTGRSWSRRRTPSTSAAGGADAIIALRCQLAGRT